MMTIKKLTKADTALFISFFETLSSLSPSPLLSDKEVFQLLDEQEKKDKHIFIMVEEEKVVGTVSVLIERKLSRGGALCAHIEDVATHREHRGKGVASQLIQHAIDYASKERNCYKLVLTCKEHLIPFYEKEGFRKKGFQLEKRND